jgi:hypothetical protein
MKVEIYNPPRPGDIGLVTMGGASGRLIRLGQWLNGDGFENYEHAFVCTDETGPGGKLMIVEAQPHGAVFRELHYAPDTVHWCTWLSQGLSPVDRAAISQAAIDCIGVPYSYLDYFSLVAKRLNVPDILLRDYVKSTDHLICSQLCAWAYYEAGCPIWPGQDWTGDDTPGDLYQMDMKMRAAFADSGRPVT